MGSRTFSPGTFPPGLFPRVKNANNIVEIEAGLMKQNLLSGGWIDETIPCKLEARLMKGILAVQRKRQVMTN